MVKTALLCLALTVYFEARGEPEIGQYAVAEVVMNRVEQTDATVCSVVYAPNQFVWTKHYTGNVPDNKDWLQSMNVASNMINGNRTNYTDGAMYFKHKRLKNNKTKVKTIIGNHVFY